MARVGSLSRKLHRKLDDKAEEGILFGFLERNQYKVYRIERKTVVVSRHV